MKTIGTAKLIGVAVLVSVMASTIISEEQSIPDAKTLRPSSGPSISIEGRHQKRRAECRNGSRDEYLLRPKAERQQHTA